MKSTLLHPALVLTLLTLVPSVAWASGGAREGLELALVFLAVVTAAYFVTHVASDWLQRRFGFVTGVEYIVLGAVVGPGFGLLGPERIGQFIPAIVLGTGSLGLLTGMQLNLRRLSLKRPPALLPSLTISAFTLTMVGSGFFALLYYSQPGGWLDHLPHALALGTLALVGDQALIRSLVAYLKARGDGVGYLLRVARASSALAVLGFGLIFCLGRQHFALAGLTFEGLTASALWFAAHLVFGAVLGLIFVAFLVRDFEEEKILTVVIGMVIFTSGLAYYLELSPIVVNFMLGFILSNISRQSERVEAMLLSVERPLYIVLFFFAGAQLRPDIPWWAFTLFAPYLVLRIGGRTLGGLVAARQNRRFGEFPSMGLSLLAPGALSVAMALDYVEVYGETPIGRMIYITMILGVVASEVLAHRSTRRWLIDAADVSPDLASRTQDLPRGEA